MQFPQIRQSLKDSPLISTIITENGSISIMHDPQKNPRFRTQSLECSSSDGQVLQPTTTPLSRPINRHTKDLYDYTFSRRDAFLSKKMSQTIDYSEYSDNQSLISAIGSLDLNKSFFRSSRERAYYKAWTHKTTLESQVENHIELIEDIWAQTTLSAQHIQYFKVNIQNVQIPNRTAIYDMQMTRKFPLRILTDTKNANCKLFFSYSHLFPDEGNHDIVSNICGKSQLRINSKPKLTHAQIYIYFAILCVRNAVVQCKINFQEIKSGLDGVQLRGYNDDVDISVIDPDEEKFNQKLERQFKRYQGSVNHPIENAISAFKRDRLDQIYRNSLQLKLKTQKVQIQKFRSEKDRYILMQKKLLSKDVHSFLNHQKFLYQQSSKAEHQFQSTWLRVLLVGQLARKIYENYQFSKISVFFHGKRNLVFKKFYRQYLKRIVLKKGTLLQRIFQDANNVTYTLALKLQDKVMIKAETILQDLLKQSNKHYVLIHINLKCDRFLQKVHKIQRYWLNKQEQYYRGIDILYYQILFKIKADDGFVQAGSEEKENKYKRGYYIKYLQDTHRRSICNQYYNQTFTKFKKLWLKYYEHLKKTRISQVRAKQQAELVRHPRISQQFHYSMLLTQVPIQEEHVPSQPKMQIFSNQLVLLDLIKLGLEQIMLQVNSDQ